LFAPSKFKSTDAYFANSKKFKNLNFLKENRETYILKEQNQKKSSYMHVK